MSIAGNFVNRLGDLARDIEAREGFNAQFILAQIAVETGWLRNVTSDRHSGEQSNNLFNIKGSYNGQSVSAPTREYYTMTQDVVDGGLEAISQRINQIEGRNIDIISIGEYKNGKLSVRIYDNFRKYPDYESSVNDWIGLLKTPRYEAAYAVRDNLEEFANAIYEAGYATDSKYVGLVLDVAGDIEPHLAKVPKTPDVTPVPEEEGPASEAMEPSATVRGEASQPRRERTTSTTPRMDNVFSYKFKLFMQGIEIPFLGAELQFSAQSYFNVEIPPVNEVNSIEPGTYAIIAFKKSGGDNLWHLLCEGIYVGPYYSKQGANRSLRLKFRDIQWFPENTTFYSIFEENNSPVQDWGLRTRAFVGDVRTVDTGHPVDGIKVLPNHLSLSSRFAFLSALNEAEGSSAETPLGRMFHGLFSKLAEGNKYVSEHSRGLRIDGNRIKAIENKKMSVVYNMAMLEESFRGQMYQTTGATSVMTIMLMLMQMVHYDLMPIPCMVADGESALRSYVAKPNMALLTPPACNVIFPDETINFGFDVNYTNRPTRLWYRSEIKSQGDTYGYFAPEGLAEEIASAADGGSEHKWVLTDEELMRGVVPQIMRLPFAYTVAITHDDNNKDDWVDYQSRFTNYHYYEMKYRSTPMSLTMSFRPDLMPGFPMLVLDRIMPMIGYCVNVGHTIDIASGAAYTSVTLSHVRPAGTDVPLMSGWYDAEQFHPDNIGDQVYNSLGTHSFWNPIEDKESFSVDVSENNMINYGSAVEAMVEEYVYNLREGLGAWKEKWSRELPVFFDEDNPEDNDILNALNLTWDIESERLRTKGSGDSPLNVNIEIGASNVNELREAPILELKAALTTTRGLWTRNILEEE